MLVGADPSFLSTDIEFGVCVGSSSNNRYYNLTIFLPFCVKTFNYNLLINLRPCSLFQSSKLKLVQFLQISQSLNGLGIFVIVQHANNSNFAFVIFAIITQILHSSYICNSKTSQFFCSPGWSLSSTVKSAYLNCCKYVAPLNHAHR